MCLRVRAWNLCTGPGTQKSLAEGSATRVLGDLWISGEDKPAGLEREVQGLNRTVHPQERQEGSPHPKKVLARQTHSHYWSRQTLRLPWALELCSGIQRRPHLSRPVTNRTAVLPSMPNQKSLSHPCPSPRGRVAGSLRLDPGMWAESIFNVTGELLLRRSRDGPIGCLSLEMIDWYIAQ